MNTLDTLNVPQYDITGYKQTGKELLDLILKEIKNLNESVLYMPLPAIIRMTQDQYDELHVLNNEYEPYHSEDKLFYTPYNIMEVRVDQRKRLTFAETQDLDNQTFEEWEKSV